MAAVRYDRDGDAHYDVVSAFIKSMRGSDVDAALHWLARMLVAGEDARFIARRLVIFASEDVGMADPGALSVATAAAHAVEYVGLPEAQLNLAQAVIHLATAPKSNSATTAIGAAIADVRAGRGGSVPRGLRDAHYAGARGLGHGTGYRYPHDDQRGVVTQQYVPDDLVGTDYYQPSQHGAERSVATRLPLLRRIVAGPARPRRRRRRRRQPVTAEVEAPQRLRRSGVDGRRRQRFPVRRAGARSRRRAAAARRRRRGSTVRSRGADRPDEGPDERRDPRAKGRRWGRGRAEAEPEEPVAGEEFGWIDDLRSAKQQRGGLGPERGSAGQPAASAQSPAGPGPRPRPDAASPGPAGPGPIHRRPAGRGCSLRLPAGRARNAGSRPAGPQSPAPGRSARSPGSGQPVSRRRFGRIRRLRRGLGQGRSLRRESAGSVTGSRPGRSRA